MASRRGTACRSRPRRSIRCARPRGRRAGRPALPSRRSRRGPRAPRARPGSGVVRHHEHLAEEIPEERPAIGPASVSPPCRTSPFGGRPCAGPGRRPRARRCSRGSAPRRGAYPAARRPRWRRASPSATRPRVTAEQRLEAFRKFVERSPDDPFARYSLAMGHRGAGQLEEAIRVFEELAAGSRATCRRISCGARRWRCRTAAPRRPGCTTGASARPSRRGNDHALSELRQARAALDARDGVSRDLRREERDMSGLMQGKRVFVTGVANDRSIAWAIAEHFHAQGAEFVFSYPGEAMGRRAIPLVKTLNPAAILDLDVSNDAQIESAVKEVAKVWDSVDVLVHCHRLRAARGARRPVHRRDHAGELAHHHGRVGLLAHRPGPRLPPRHEARVVHRHAQLLRRREGGHELQRDGRSPRQRWRRRSATWPRTWAGRGSA